MSDRPATEPRTEAGKQLAAKAKREGAESHERFHPTWDCIDCTHSWLGSHSDTGCHVEGCGCTEPNPYHRPAAAQGAAPRAEGLDALLEQHQPFTKDTNDYDAGSVWLACSCGWEDWDLPEGTRWMDHVLASRPSDERVPEEER